MISEKIKVYTYTRVSTAMQIDGYSLDAQNMEFGVIFRVKDRQDPKLMKKKKVKKG